MFRVFSIDRLTAAMMIMAAASLSACNQQDPETDDPSPTQEEASQRTTQDEGERRSAESQPGEERDGQPDTPDAVAKLDPTQGSSVSGTVRFTELGSGVRVRLDARGLSAGRHGFHIHAYGDCSAPDASSAGGHYNPEDVEHGAPDDEKHHAGDLGNIEVDETGQATLERTFSFLTLAGENSIAGKSVVIHAGADDLESQPSGDAGARVACGVIRGHGQ